MVSEGEFVGSVGKGGIEGLKLGLKVGDDGVLLGELVTENRSL